MITVDGGDFVYYLWMYPDSRWELQVVMPAARRIVAVHIGVNNQDPFKVKVTYK